MPDDKLLQGLDAVAQELGLFPEDAPGKYLLMSPTGVVGTFDTRLEAVFAGYRQLGSVPFLVQHVPEAPFPTDTE